MISSAPSRGRAAPARSALFLLVVAALADLASAGYYGGQGPPQP